MKNTANIKLDIHQVNDDTARTYCGLNPDELLIAPSDDPIYPREGVTCNECICRIIHLDEYLDEDKGFYEDEDCDSDPRNCNHAEEEK